MVKYQVQFEEISTQVTGLSKQWLVSFFIYGLVEHLKCELLLAQPPTYYQAISLAKLHEKLKGGSVKSFNSVTAPKTSGSNFIFLFSTD